MAVAELLKYGAKLQRKFYDRTWSAVEAVAAGKAASNELHAAVAAILKKKRRSTYPRRFFLTSATGDCPTHTIEHLEPFPNRLIHVMRVRVAKAVSHLK